MKFTELHIAVVTFHPCEIYFLVRFPSYAFFRGLHEWKERKGNGMRENRMDRENEGIHETKSSKEKGKMRRIKEGKIKTERGESEGKKVARRGKKEIWRKRRGQGWREARGG